MKILAIETSCDETAISIVEAKCDMDRPSFRILSNIVHSQVELHKKYGGVYPNLAKREHGRNLVPVLMQSLGEAGFEISNLQAQDSKQFSTDIFSKLKKIFEREPELLDQFLKNMPKIKKPAIDAIAVTHGPGLEPALWVGINFAKALALVWNIPVIPVNHMEGHIFSAFMDGDKFSISNVDFPVLALLVSGGHTELILIKDWLQYEKIGQTRDDAAGEAFDKVARILGLPYPGGPEISKLAEHFAGGGLTKSIIEEPGLTSKEERSDGERSDLSGKIADLTEQNVRLPRPMINTDDFDFSFSGLKTAVLYMAKKIPKLTEQIKADIAREFQQAVIDVLLVKTMKAAKKHGAKTIVLGGGVAANKELRKQLDGAIAEELPSSAFMTPSDQAAGDNAAMIAVAGYFKYIKDETAKSPPIQANGNLSL